MFSHDCNFMRYRTANNLDNTIRITVRVSPELKDTIIKSALKMGISSNELIRRALRKYLDESDAEFVSKVYDALNDPEYIRLLKEKLKES